MRVDHTLREQLVASIPHLRAFACSLTRDNVHADDLVQDTLVRAWSRKDHFDPATNLMAWLFTILRNCYYSQKRSKWREVQDAEGTYASSVACAPEQDGHLAFEDLRIALRQLASEQREAILLVAAEGSSYAEAAQICGVAVGTIKSRASRGRARLARLLSMEHPGDIGPDRITRAALAWQSHGSQSFQ